MGRRLVRVFLIRAGLIAAPFVIWFIWRAWAIRNGREMGATPWAWLSAAAALLFGASVLITPLFRDTPDRGRYVPAEVQPDGSIAPGRLEEP